MKKPSNERMQSGRANTREDLNSGGALQLKFNQFVRDRIRCYSVQCIPRDGASTDAIEFKLVIGPTAIRGPQRLDFDSDAIGQAFVIGAGEATAGIVKGICRQ